MKKLWNKTKNWLKETWKELKDWKTLILYLIVMAVLSCEVWIPYIIALVTGNNWWWGIGSICWAFWLGPGTPFTLISITITVAIKKMLTRHKRRHKDDM